MVYASTRLVSRLLSQGARRSIHIPPKSRRPITARLTPPDGQNQSRPPPPPPRPSRGPSDLDRKIYIWGFIGLNTVVFFAWWGSIVSDAMKAARAKKAGEEVSGPLATQFMKENFNLSSDNLTAGRWWTTLTNAVSHVHPMDLAFNMITFYAISSIGFAVQLRFPRMVTLGVGSALASGGSMLWDQRTRQAGHVEGFAHGASGLVQGLGVAVALTAPHVPVNLMFIPIPIPLYVVIAGFIGWDLWNLAEERRLAAKKGEGKGVGYAAHLGGAVFGAVYYYTAIRYRIPKLWY